MKISKRNLSRLIESLLRGSELEMSLKDRAFEEINSLSQGDKDVLNNYLTSISPNLNVSNILSSEEIDLEKDGFNLLDENKSIISELIKSLLEKDEEHITSYIKEITPVVEEHPSYSDMNIKYWYKDGKRHREGDKPAEISYYDDDGSIQEETWYKNGKIHREGDKPAVVEYSDDDGSIWQERWYKDGQNYREGDKPTEISYYNYEEGLIDRESWLKDNYLHREGGKPALIMYNEDGSIKGEFWYEDGVEYFPGKEL